MCVQLLGGTAPLKFWIAKKRPKFGAIYDNFQLWTGISWNGWRNRQAVNGVMNYCLSRIEEKNLVNFGPLTTTVSWLMSTYLKSTLCILHMLMRWSSGHITLLGGECEPPKLSPQPDLGRRADSRWALPQIASCFCFPNGFVHCVAVLTLPH